MRYLLLLACGGLFAVVSAAPMAGAARMVFHLSVEDQTGRPVDGLPASAFSLLIDGVAHPIESVGPAALPLSVILLVDESDSMKLFEGRLDGAAKDFVVNLDAADRWRMGAFAERIVFSGAFASGPSSFRIEPRLPLSLRERTVAGGSPLWDAVHQSVELLNGERDRRRMVLVFTDGRASGNQHTFGEVAEFAVDASVAFSAIAPVRSVDIRQDQNTVAVVSPEVGLERLARYTGGLLLGGFELKEDPLKQLRKVALRLRAGYALHFVLPNPDGRRHRLDVAVTTPGLQVRAPMAFRSPNGKE